MKTLVLFFAFISVASVVLADGSPYIGVGLGGVQANDARYSYDGSSPSTGELQGGRGVVVEAAFGYDPDVMPLRFEVALSALANEIDSIAPDGLGGVMIPIDEGGMAIGAVMFNAYFDIPTGTVVEPYLFIGAGRASVHHELSNKEVNDRVGAAQLGVGLGFVVSDHFLLDLKYRYFTTDDYMVGNGAETLAAEYSCHQILVGFRVRF